MSFEAWLTLLTLGVTFALLARERVAPALAVFGADVFLLVTGVLAPAEAFSGFSNPAPFTVAALYVVARAVERTGALQPLLAGALGDAASHRAVLARLLSPVAASSAFLNNTPIVAMVAPQVEAWARKTGRSPSRYLMPLSFAAILGGVITVIGTSTTIVVSGLVEARGMEPLGMFEIAPLGLPLAVVGLLYLVLAAPRLLPERRSAFDEMDDRTRHFTVEMAVVPGGPLDGATVRDGALRNLAGVFLVEVRREQEVVAPATPDTLLHGGDRLVFAGRVDDVLDLRNRPGLVSAEEEHAEDFQDGGHTYFEAVIGASSPLVGSTLKEVRFRSAYQAAVVGIHRAGEPVRAKLGAVELKPGDTLLLLSDEEFLDRWRDRRDFLLVSRYGGAPPVSSGSGWIVGAVLAGIVVGSASGLLPILHAALIGALTLVAAGVLGAGEARRAVDLDVVVLIAAAFGLGAAVETTGLASLAVTGVVDPLASWMGPTGAVLAIVLVTLALTEVVTNNAAAVLVFPVAMTAALEHDVGLRAMALGLAVAASASFLTPIGYQTNTMVYGPGGYRFTDYVRFGIPLTLLVIAGLAVGVPLMDS